MSVLPRPLRLVKVLCFTYDSVGPYSSFSIRDFVKIGEWYDVYEHEDRYTIEKIKHDGLGYKCDLAKGYFKTIDEVRAEKLKQLEI